MPGGATSSSQEGALKQGYIHLLPDMLRFLGGTRQIVHYHDVTPGTQITWNLAFLAVTGAFKRGGESEVQYLLEILDNVTRTSEEDLSPEMKDARLTIYQDCNDAFRGLLLGEFGKLPLGFPPDWVYQSAFGPDWKKAVNRRTEQSPLSTLQDVDFDAERADLRARLHREPTEEEFLMYLNHPADAVKTIEFKQNFGDPNNLPLSIWFEGMDTGEDLHFLDSRGKPHHMTILRIQTPDPNGVSVVRYVLDSEIMSTEVQVSKPRGGNFPDIRMADPENMYQVGAPSNGDLWVMYVNPGDIVKKGEELFNISIMKQEKAILAPVDGIVKSVMKTADYRSSKQMVPVREGELIVELGPVPLRCGNPQCAKPLPSGSYQYCPFCGRKNY
jgi:pyruvate carboxylase